MHPVWTVSWEVLQNGTKCMSFQLFSACSTVPCFPTSSDITDEALSSMSPHLCKGPPKDRLGPGTAAICSSNLQQPGASFQPPPYVETSIRVPL